MWFVLISLIVTALLSFAAVFTIDPRELYDISLEDYLKWENFKKNFWK